MSRKPVEPLSPEADDTACIICTELFPRSISEVKSSEFSAIPALDGRIKIA